MTKHLVVWQQRVRKARSSVEEPVAPFLWVITAGAPTKIMSKLKLEHATHWPSGVYLFGDEILRIGITVASELPHDSTTLLVRLMAAGPLLGPAVRELAALAPDAHERVVAEPILLSFQHVLGQSASRNPEEQEFIMAMLKSWEEGKAEARAEARAETQAEAVLTVLRVRGIAVSDVVRDRISSQTDLAQLKRWLEIAVVATTIDDVLGDAR